MRRHALRSLVGEQSPYLRLLIGILLFSFTAFNRAPTVVPAPQVLVHGELRESFVESRPDGSARAVHFSLRNSARQYWTTETGAALTPTRKDGRDVHLEFYVDSQADAAVAGATSVRAQRLVANGRPLASAETAVRTGAGSLCLILRVLGAASLALGTLFWVRNFRGERRSASRSA